MNLLDRLLRASPLDMCRSFVEEGGTSHSYHKAQLHFQQAGKNLPPSSETFPLANFAAHTSADLPVDRTRWVLLSGDVIWRIAAITRVIFHHTTPWKPCLMLVLAGLSLARFQKRQPLRGPLLVGYIAILTLVHVTGKPVDIEWYLLLGNFDLDINPPVVEVLNPSQVISGLRIRHTFGGLELFMIGWCIHFAQSDRAKWIMLMALIAIFLRHWSGISLSAAIFIYLGVSTSLIRAHIRVPSGLANSALSMASVTMFADLIHPIVQSVVEPMCLPLWVLALAVSVISFVAATIVKLAIDRLAAIQVRQVA